MKKKKTNFSAVRYPCENNETVLEVSAAAVEDVYWHLSGLLSCECVFALASFDKDSDPAEIKTFLSEWTHKCQKAERYVCEHRHIVESPAFLTVSTAVAEQINEFDEAFQEAQRMCKSWEKSLSPAELSDLEEQREFSGKIYAEMSEIATRYGVEKYR